MFTHYITSINYRKLIEWQANQRTFAPGTKNRKKMLEMSNRMASFPQSKKKTGSKVKTIGRQRESKRK